MNTSELAARFGYEQLHGDYDDAPLTGGYTSDLLSDVMAKAGDGNALITIQAHRNTVAVATLVGAAAIVICNARPIPDDMVAAARKERVALFRTPDNQFQVSGRLYAALQGA